MTLTILCAECGTTLTEDFDRCRMSCGRCGRHIPLDAALSAVTDLVTLLRDELARSAKPDRPVSKGGRTLPAGPVAA